MEFKFSCRWFEISFSGDPHFVEKQLEKYEPFVMAALKKTEEDPKKPDYEQPPPRPQFSQPYNQSFNQQDNRGNRQDYHQQRDHQGQQRWDNRRHQDGDRYRQGGNRWDRRPNDYNQRRDMNRDMNRPDHGRERHDQQQSRPQREPVKDDDGESYPQAQALTAPAPAPQPPPVLTVPSAPPAEPPAAPARTDVDEEVMAPEEEPAEARENGGAGEGPDDTPSAPGEFSARRRIPKIRAEELIENIESTKPRTHHDRVMVFGYYMEKMGGGSDFTIAEIKRCYRAVNQDPGTNIEQVITHATRSGFVLRHEQGRTTRFKLSPKGRRYVEDGLKLT